MSSASSAQTHPSPIKRALAVITDLRFLRIVGQLVFFALILFALAQLWNNITSALTTNNLTPNITFMDNRAGFEIGGAQGYTPDDTYWEAFMVGLKNTLSIIVFGLIGATVIGILGGIFLLSGNWLIRNITRFFVEILRNTPLLVQIFIMFFVVVLSLPPLRDSLAFPRDGITLISYTVIGYVTAALVLWFILRKASHTRKVFGWVALAATIVTITLLFWLANNQPATWGDIYGSGDLGDVRFWLFIGLCIIGIAAAFLFSVRFRPSIWGAVTGILIGGLLFYFGVVPTGGLRIELSPIVYLNNRGLVYPEVYATSRFAEWFAFVAIGFGFAVALFFYLRRLTEMTGKPYPRMRYALLVFLAFTIIGWAVVSGEPAPQNALVEENGVLVSVPVQQAIDEELITREQSLQYIPTPLDIVLPERQGLRFGSGQIISPEYTALLLALVIYTAAFIAEIVRAGILAVPRGQLEAARALGLSYSQLLRMVILPQALRVIIPPLTNQYLNLAKNSSLAIAISFADVYQVMNTVGNQSGQSVTAITIVMITYLIISLVISTTMNWVNGRFQLVTR